MQTPRGIGLSACRYLPYHLRALFRLRQQLSRSKRVNSARTSDDDAMLIERVDGVVDQDALAATIRTNPRSLGNIK